MPDGDLLALAFLVTLAAAYPHAQPIRRRGQVLDVQRDEFRSAEGAREAGASIFKLMEVSRHKSMDTLRGYVRRAGLFRDRAGSGFP